jgi:hypothetical protein
VVGSVVGLNGGRRRRGLGIESGKCWRNVGWGERVGRKIEGVGVEEF